MSRKLPKSGPKWMKEGVSKCAAHPRQRAANQAAQARRAHRLELLGTPHALKMARKLLARAT